MPEDKNYRHIVRVANTDLDGKKQLHHALLKIKGVGFIFSNAVCAVAGLDKHMKTGNLTEAQASKLTEVITNPLSNKIPKWLLNRRKDSETGDDIHIITGDLDFIQSNDVKYMKKTKSYKGLRHQWKLPVRGQRTKSNFRKNKGKVSLGVQRKKGKSGK